MPLVNQEQNCKQELNTDFLALNSIRDGVIQEIYAKYLIPGDLVYITVGDRVPADFRLFEVRRVQWFNISQ